MNKNIKYINKIVTAKIDRPLGSIHSSKYPKHIYPLNYGYIPNTLSGDSEEIDCYILGVYEPIDTFTGKCIAIIHRLNDNDDKLVLVPEGEKYTNEEIKALTQFQERFFNIEILRDNSYVEYNKNLPELSVTNLKESLKFYKTLGFEIGYERPEDKFAFICIDEIQFMLQELDSSDKWDVGKLTFPFGNGINFQLDLKEIDKIYNNLLKNNYKIAFDMEENWYRKDDVLLGCKEFLVQDPDGYLLRISEDLGQRPAN